MIYSIYIAVILTVMLALAIVYRLSGNKVLKRVLQGIAIVLAVAAYYFHVKAQAAGEYHAISLDVAEYVVNFVQHFSSTVIGKKVMWFVTYAQSEKWVVNVLSVAIFTVICLISFLRKR